jgi:hypothetical protein
MTILTQRPETNTNEYEPKRLSTVALEVDDPRFDEWVRARKEFVVAKGWREDSDEEMDIYDGDSITAQLVTYGENGELLFGMRLTPINKILNSLSWDMVKDSTIHEQATEDAEKIQDQLWDLTRLVPGPDVPLSERANVIRKLFYDGLQYCKAQGDADPVWFFALDKAMNAWIRRQGVKISLLGQAQIGNDEVETLFGFIRPAQISEDKFAPSALYARLAQGGDYNDR